MRDALKWVIDDKQSNNEIAFTYIARLEDYSWYDKPTMNEQMKLWRKQFKEGIITIDEMNHRSPTISGKQYHIFVVQNADLDANPQPLDRTGFGFDDHQFLVSGHIYCFKSIANRDSIFKYVTTGKA